jgi:Uma2 family endonuclease
LAVQPIPAANTDSEQSVPRVSRARGNFCGPISFAMRVVGRAVDALPLGVDEPRGIFPTMVGVARTRATYAEYLAFAEIAELKHEYIDGEIVAMSGGTIAHGRLIGQVTGLIRDALRGRTCIVVPSEVRVRIRAADRATYPDLFVVCDGVESDPDDDHAVINPTVIVEVLSSTTADSDRGDKFAAYRRLRSLREYVLVSQKERRIDVYRRDGRRWQLEEYGGGETFELESIRVAVTVDDVYVDALGTIVAAH